jgi:hypothetical protein
MGNDSCKDCKSELKISRCGFCHENRCSSHFNPYCGKSSVKFYSPSRRGEWGVLLGGYADYYLDMPDYRETLISESERKCSLCHSNKLKPEICSTCQLNYKCTDCKRNLCWDCMIQIPCVVKDCWRKQLKCLSCYKAEVNCNWCKGRNSYLCGEHSGTSVASFGFNCDICFAKGKLVHLIAKKVSCKFPNCKEETTYLACCDHKQEFSQISKEFSYNRCSKYFKRCEVCLLKRIIIKVSTNADTPPLTFCQDHISICSTCHKWNCSQDTETVRGQGCAACQYLRHQFLSSHLPPDLRDEVMKFLGVPILSYQQKKLKKIEGKSKKA